MSGEKCNILVLNGPNLQLLGSREPEIYGKHTYEDLELYIANAALELGLGVDIRQTNYEGVLLDWIAVAPEKFHGVLINPAAYTHTSLALQDAINAISIPACEVHLTNINAREECRRKSFTAPACAGVICGFGFHSYRLGLEALRNIILHL